MIYFNTYDLIINYFAHFVDEEIETQRLFGFPTMREREREEGQLGLKSGSRSVLLALPYEASTWH